ncbi:MAG TPA: heavy metal-associated domain-containing protein [Patescibacteria group bacterium]|nr:heavy metal-associated domain-containing protein [Patescibacteria group bacterium]
MFNFFKKGQKSKVYKIQGMHCESCAVMLESDLEEAGINAKCSYPRQTLEVDESADISQVKEIVLKSGYEI